MKNFILPLFLLFIGTFLVSGCDLTQPKPNRQPVALDIPPEQHQLGQNQQDQAPQNPPAQDEDNTIMVRAQAGVGAQGQRVAAVDERNPNNPARIITTPISAMFRTEQRIIFDLQIAPAMNLFRATHDRLPNSHEEFMREIIQANNISLPQLPAGQEYVYDPQRGELMVRRPQ